ncbi:MAG TPA: putative Ig domain-containing protein, partial [Acidimicrobiales bacterium]
SATLAASGGPTPYTWSASGLPPGLSLAAATGVISGSPTRRGIYNVKVTVTDSANPAQTATTTLKLTVGR